VDQNHSLLETKLKSSAGSREAKNAKMDLKHHSDSAEEKQEVAEITTSDNRDATMMGSDRRPRCSIEIDEWLSLSSLGSDEDLTSGAFAYSKLYRHY
jgi:hypothetical protein